MHHIRPITYLPVVQREHNNSDEVEEKGEEVVEFPKDIKAKTITTVTPNFQRSHTSQQFSQTF